MVPTRSLVIRAFIQESISGFSASGMPWARARSLVFLAAIVILPGSPGLVTPSLEKMSLGMWFMGAAKGSVELGQ